jgi:hypothetical protein
MRQALLFFDQAQQRERRARLARLSDFSAATVGGDGAQTLFDDLSKED